MAYKVDPIDLIFQHCKERCPEIHESLWDKLERRAVNELLARRDDKEREPSGSMAERLSNNRIKRESR